MVDDERCCGTGTCLINAEGQCWCGQRWDGQKMCFAPQVVLQEATSDGQLAASLAQPAMPD